MSELLSVTDLSVSYDRVTALRSIDISVESGEFVALIGPNGAGKSTFADAVSGFVEYEGSIRYQGAEIADTPMPTLIRRGLVHCSESRDLFEYMTVESNLRLGAYQHRENLEDRLEYVYDIFPRLEERAGQKARTMSGGEQQMLAIGRTLMADPELVILDEPTLGLAPMILTDISDCLREIQERGVTVVLCEQNVTFALDHADRVHLIENGELVLSGQASDIEKDSHIRDVYIGE